MNPQVSRTKLGLVHLAVACGLGSMAAGFMAIPALAVWAAEPPRIVYPKKTELDFEGLRIQGEVRNPGEFYYQRKNEEKFDSLVKRRPHFRREMLRDVVMSR